MKHVNIEQIAKIITGENFNRVSSLTKENSTNFSVLRESYIKRGYISINNDSLDNIDVKNESLNNKNLYLKDRITTLGDIVVSIKYPFNAALIEEKDTNKLVDSYCFIIKNIDSSINKYYLLAYLNSSVCKDYILSLCNTNKNLRDIKTVNLKVYKLIDIPLLDSNFEMEKISLNYKKIIEKTYLFNKILNLENEINNQKFIEILGDNNE